ncbi:MAG: SAM-dependent methyltransferase [Solirubrobacteraceae bacterium]
MTAMTAADFEARYRSQPDPWGYQTSEYERAKYAATLRACGPGLFDGALELGGSIGVFSALLAPRCHSLVTIDAAPTAVTAARRRLAGSPAAEIILGSIPEAIPRRRYDLVVASEILYYLDRDRLAATLDALRRLTAAGARVVAVHWRAPGPERPLHAAEVHCALREQPWLAPVARADTDRYLLDVLERLWAPDVAIDCIRRRLLGLAARSESSLAQTSRARVVRLPDATRGNRRCFGIDSSHMRRQSRPATRRLPPLAKSGTL